MNPEINLTTLHESIKSALAARFPGVVVDYYIRPGERVPAPAIYFELESIDSANPADSGTEQLEVMLTFSAKVICTYKHGQKLAVRVLAANLAKYIQRNRWGQPVTPGQFMGSVQEDFAAKEDEYESFRVNWSHTAYLGVSYWDAVGIMPEHIYLGFPPNIGIGHEADYIEIPSTDLLPEI